MWSSPSFDYCEMFSLSDLVKTGFFDILASDGSNAK
jgi:hypothetical protein